MALRGDVELRATGGERVFDGAALALLMWPATGGMWLLGSTRAWGYAPGLVLAFAGALLVLARPLVFARTPAWRVPPGFWAFAAMIVYVTAGSRLAAVPDAAGWEALRWSALLAAGFAWVQLGGRGHRWKWLLGVLLIAVTMNGLYAMVQHVDSSRNVLWAVRPDQYGLRASGTYLCPNHFANMLAMLVPVAAVLLALPEAGVPLRLLAVYFLGVAAPVLYWTQSRSGWLGMLAGLGVTAFLLAWRRSRKALLVALVAIPLAAAAVGGLAWVSLPAVRERMGMVLENPEKAGGVRIKMWRDAPAMIRDRPWTGFGGGSYVWAYPPYQHYIDEHRHWDFPHNEYLQVQLEYGAIGLGLTLLGLVLAGTGLARGVLRGRSREGAFLLAGAGGAVAVNLVHALFDFNFHIFPNPHALVWIGGVAWGVWAAQEKGRKPPAGRWRTLRRGLAAAGAVLCGLGAWASAAGGMSYLWNLKGDLAKERMEWDLAAEHYRRAMAWDDANWRPHLGLGQLTASRAIWYRDPDLEAERAGKRRLAEDAVGHFHEALARNPWNMEGEYGLARALLAQGDTEGALARYRKAAEYQRRHVFYREQLGIQLRRLGRTEEALEVFRRNMADKVFTDVSVRNIYSLERQLARQSREETGASKP